MVELERELTFLVDKLPANLDKFPSKIIEDNYLPADSEHPMIRIRRNGDKLEITKKYPVDSLGGVDGDSSHMVEHTIPLSLAEYAALNTYAGKKFKKRRFAYQIDGYVAELDVYLDKLSGLAVIDFEFDSDAAMKKFKKPDFIGADVTQETIIAGGMLCGKSKSDIANYLREKYNYQPVVGVEKYNEKESK
jgi:CYTH domain-containing protein